MAYARRVEDARLTAYEESTMSFGCRTLMSPDVGAGRADDRSPPSPEIRRHLIMKSRGGILVHSNPRSYSV